MKSNNNNILIIGTGINALSAAYSISKLDKNTKIHLVGPINNLGSASHASGAMINCFAELNHKSLSSTPGKAKFEIAYKALKSWESWTSELNEEIEDKTKKLSLNKGTYVILNSESGQLDSDNYNAMKKALIDFKEPFDEIEDVRKIPGINPVPNLRPLSGIFLPNESSIDSNNVLEQLKTILNKNPNIQFTDGKVVSIEEKNSSISSVTLETGHKLYADKFIIANGAYAQALTDQVPQLKESIPKIFAGLGISILVQQDQENPINHVIRTPNRSGACGLHALPRQDSLYLGATNNVFLKPQEKLRAGLTKFLLTCAFEQLNQNLYHSPIEGYHVGNRPVSFDGFPLIGKTNLNNLWMINGTYRDGFHNSPVISEMIAKEIVKGEFQENNIFTPNRKLLKSMTKEESLEEFLFHHTAATFEHSAKLPGIMSVKEFEKMIRAKMNIIYDKLDTDYGINPEILFMIDFEPNQEEMISSIRSI